MKYKNNLFIFRRDLRINDNLGLIECNNDSDRMLLVFLFDTKRNSMENEFYNPYSLSYLLKALNNLKEKIDIKIIVTENELETIKSIVVNEEISSIYENKDFTDYAKKRSDKIKEFCDFNNISYCNNFYDYVILEPGKIENSGKYYKVFTPFYKKFINELEKTKVKIKKLKKEELKLGIWKEKYSELDIEKELKKIEESKCVNFKTRKDIADYLTKVKDYKDYDKKRNFLKYSNSELSASIKFGIISIRELSDHCINNMGINSKFFRQLIWREFWYHFHTLVWNREFGIEFQDAFNNYWKIDYSNEKFKMWSEARTGVGIVDAAINELRKTGRMHNRARMIVASYLVKNLDVHWRQGEVFFARFLLDYDPIVNHWSWQWSAGTGTDTMMYSRIFNPFLQSEKFDNDKTYRKKWLKDVNLKDDEEIQKKVTEERRMAVEKYNLWKRKYADN